LRVAESHRKTRETEVYVKVNLDGMGEANVEMKPGFCAHMITSLATHSLIDITVKAQGDLEHHIMEDVAICLGEAIQKALGDAAGISRFGYAIVPMDCSLAFAAVDLSKRPYAKIELKLERKAIEGMPVEDLYHFLETLTTAMRANIHLLVQYGMNDHHKAEAAFKALALSLRQAASIDPRRMSVPSSKGVI
jgi:imidazoleglycerol-phosphate dehydratase